MEMGLLNWIYSDYLVRENNILTSKGLRKYILLKDDKIEEY